MRKMKWSDLILALCCSEMDSELWYCDYRQDIVWVIIYFNRITLKYFIKHACGVSFSSNESCKTQRFHILIRSIMIQNSHSPPLLLFLCDLQPDSHLLYWSQIIHPHVAELSIIVIHLVHAAWILCDVTLQSDEHLSYLWCTYCLPDVAERWIIGFRLTTVVECQGCW